jgi:hypothetical protein
MGFASFSSELHYNCKQKSKWTILCVEQWNENVKNISVWLIMHKHAHNLETMKIKHNAH